MRFRNAQFPRHASVLDGGERRGAGAAAVASDYEMIGTRLYHACGDGADTDGRAELDADARFRIAVLQVVNELRDVFDGIDVVMRWRADQANARRGVADGRNVVVYFSSGQFAAFARFRALDDLDL